MKKIGDMLNFKSLEHLDPSIAKKVICDCIQKNFGISLSIDEITLIGRTIKINTSALKKQEIRMREKQILEKIKEEVPEKNYTELS